MAKAIEVLNSSGKSYHVTVDQAWALVRAGNAHWLNGKQIERTPDQWTKCSWAKKQSGSAGPMVMQIIT